MADNSTGKIEEPAEFEDRKIYDVSVDDILEDKEQPRKYFDEEAKVALKASIITQGMKYLTLSWWGLASCLDPCRSIRPRC